MAKLTWQITQLLKHNRDGSMGTQHNRKKILLMAAEDLKQIGFNQLDIKGLKAKHVVKLINKWSNDISERGNVGVSNATLKNRMAQLRWWAEKVNTAYKIPSNNELNIGNRIYVTNISKAVKLEQNHLDQIESQHVRYSLKLQSLFGLRREESIKFKVDMADKGDKIVLKDTWCKGKRSREIPIDTVEQRNLLDELKSKFGDKSLIPDNNSYKQQMLVYQNQVYRSDLGKGHGLRHNYAQMRYKELSGNNCPALGGIRLRDMNISERAKDKEYRLIISNELGHKREQVTSIYLGS